MAARQFGAKREARTAVRRLVDLECEVYSALWGEAIPHRAVEVSENGLWIHTDLLLEVGTEVTLTFYPPDWDEPLCVAGRVRRVELRSRPGDGNAVGMGVAFEALRNDERRRLTHSMRCLRAQESYILDQRTLTGVPVGVPPVDEPTPDRGRTLAGWSAPAVAPTRPDRPSRVTASPANRDDPDHARGRAAGAFRGGLDLAASVFASETPD
jgi:Tfp pilus assembly protein PilZ